MKSTRALSTRWRMDLEAIAAKHRTTLEVLQRKGRSTDHHAAARRECYFYLQDHGWSSPQIGALFNRDHTTILYWTTPGARERITARHVVANERRRVALAEAAR